MTTMFADAVLARRLERAEGRASARFIDARAKVSPDAGAAWMEIDGTLAMFDGAESPLTQTFGLGMTQAVTPATLEGLESFFALRGAPVFHEVSPLAHSSVWPLLHARGYTIVEFTSVMWRSVVEASPAPAAEASDVTARAIAGHEHDLWATVTARGWSHVPEITPFLSALGRLNPVREGHVPFVAERRGEVIAAGGLVLDNGVALLAGAATVPEARRLGAQRALLAERLRFAAHCGCDVAMMCALPGSDSQRNAERQGFRVAYTRLKWKRVG